MPSRSPIGRQAVFWIAFVGLVAAFVYLFKGILFPFVLGMTIAYFLDPLVDRLERTRLPRPLLSALVLAAFFGAGVAVLLIIVPPLQAQLVALVRAIPDLVTWLKEHLAVQLQRFEGQIPPAEMQELSAVAKGYAADAVKWLGSVVAGLWTGGLAIVNLVSLVIVTPVVAFYLLSDWDRIVARVDGLLPRDHAPVIRRQVREMDEIIAAFVRGVGSVALFFAAYYGIALSLVGLDYGLVVGIGAGLITFIPFVGSVLGFSVAVVLALFQFESWTPVAMVAGVFVVGQLLESNVITPKLVGERIGLHPVWVMFALLGGGLLFGFVGVLLAVPAAAVIGVLVRFAIGQYLEGPFYKGTGGGAGGGPAGPRHER
ncbi:MAG: AI-2E family transporter [Alphaproteobacteria bacterium]